MSALSSARPSRILVLSVALLVVGGVAAPVSADAYKDATRALERALAAKDTAGAKAAIADIASDNSKRAVEVLLEAAVPGRDLDCHDALLAGLIAQTDPAAVKLLAAKAKSHRDWTIRYLIVEALAGIDDAGAREALFKAYSDKHPLVAVGAMDASAENLLTAAVPELIARLEEVERRPKGQERIGEAAIAALKTITGQAFVDAFEWQGWWKVNSDRFNPDEVDRSGSGSKSSTVLRRIEKRGDQQFLEELAAGDIYCVTGDFDAVEDVLEALELPHTVVDRTEFGAKIAEIPPTAVIVFNCDGNQNALSADGVKGLTAFVERGGYVFTSDWELEAVLMRAVPGFVAVGQEATEQEVSIRPGPNALMHPYLRDVFPANPYEAAKFRWKIDDQSYTVKVGNPKVLPLVVSDELGKAYGTDTVAATYRYGKGSVLHVMSHFEKQTDPKGDGYALQQLFLNFVVEKQKFRRR